MGRMVVEWERMPQLLRQPGSAQRSLCGTFRSARHSRHNCLQISCQLSGICKVEGIGGSGKLRGRKALYYGVSAAFMDARHRRQTPAKGRAAWIAQPCTNVTWRPRQSRNAVGGPARRLAWGPKASNQSYPRYDASVKAYVRSRNHQGSEDHAIIQKLVPSHADQGAGPTQAQAPAQLMAPSSSSGLWQSRRPS